MKQACWRDRGFGAALILALIVTLPGGCGQPADGFAVLGGPGRGPGQFATPRGVAAGSERLFAVDRSGRLQAFALDGSFIAQVIVAEGRVGFPIGVAADADGGVTLVDTHQSRIRRFDGALHQVGMFGANGLGSGEFTYPQRAVRDAEGRLYVTEYGDGAANRVQVFDAAGTWLRTFGAWGQRDGGFTRPMGITLLGDEVFITDVSDRIVVYGTDGGFRREFGRTGEAAGELRYPYGICVLDGLLYVCEYGNHRLQRFAPDGSSRGVCGTLGSGAWQFRGPWDVTADRRGRLIVADTGNDRVVIVDPRHFD